MKQYNYSSNFPVLHLPRRNGTEEPNSPAELLLSLTDNNFIVIPGYFGATVLFEKKHFYHYYRNDVVNCKLNFQCRDSQFLLLVDPTGKQQTRRRKCPSKPGELHNHEVLSQEMLELAAVFWECLLRMFSHRKPICSLLNPSCHHCRINSCSLCRPSPNFVIL